jgi:hypothetical protein
MFDRALVKDLLETTLASVLADMAFLDCVPAAGPEGAAASLEHCAAIDALKPGSFRIELRVGEAFRKKIVAMLFDEAAGGQGIASETDLLLEILNVLAGNFITGYFGDSAMPKLELPRYLYVTDPAEGEVVAETWMDAEGDPLRITLRSVRYRY